MSRETVQPGEGYATDRLCASIQLAAITHANQQDKAGVPYILHPIHVLNVVARITPKMENAYEWESCLCAAVLHDTIEDGDPARVRSAIYKIAGDRTLAAVEALSHLDKHETYEQYVERLCKDWIARRVKLVDLHHNLMEGRAILDPAKNSRYNRAVARIRQVDESIHNYPLES